MKILHTSDWHLGQTLYGRKRYDEFERFLDWLVQTLHDEKADVLLVSGDIFDSGMPSNSAQTLYYDFLLKAAQGPCRHMVITAGNHDSPSFLDAPQALLRTLDVHVVGRARTPEEEVLLLSDAEGRPELIVCAIPFLRDRDLYKATAGDTVDERDRLLAEGMREHYRRCCGEADRLRRTTAEHHNDPAAPYLPIVAMGHLYAAGGTVAEGDGVRDLRIGSLGQIDAAIFPPVFDYVALGHLHIAQRINGQERIRYSGSPLPMGFGEAGQQKKVFLVEWTEGDASVRALDVPQFQKLEKIQGDLPEIEKRLEELSKLNESVWLEVLYTGSAVVSDLRERLLEKAAPAVEILRVRTQRGLEASLSAEREEESLDDLSLNDVFERRLDDAERNSALTAEQREVLRDTYSEALRDYFQSKDERRDDREGGERCVS